MHYSGHFPIKKNLVTATPNPASNDVQISFHTDGGHTLLQLVSKEGVPLQTMLEASYEQPQVISKTINISAYKTGLYYIRFQNGKNVQMKAVIKVQ